ncbi:MAG: hypothetical protein ICV73_10505 [Acetobacteraceae bacterium]|nr:hypothetical protein [Acetobacteraceae bacterium]
MLDERHERRAVVDAGRPTLHRALRSWAFDSMSVPFMAHVTLGGAFHCATLDVRRRGTLRDHSAWTAASPMMAASRKRPTQTVLERRVDGPPARHRHAAR